MARNFFNGQIELRPQGTEIVSMGMSFDEALARASQVDWSTGTPRLPGDGGVFFTITDGEFPIKLMFHNLTTEEWFAVSPRLPRL